MREAVVQRQYDERPERLRNVDARERLLDVGRVVAVSYTHLDVYKRQVLRIPVAVLLRRSAAADEGE